MKNDFETFLLLQNQARYGHFEFKIQMDVAAQFLSHTVAHTHETFKINLTFKDVLMLLLRFFDISFSLESAKNHGNRGLHV